MKPERAIVIAGGGTGGHVHPGLAIARELRKQRSGLRIEWIGARGGLEERLVPAEQIPLLLLPLTGAARRGLISGLVAGWLALLATLRLVGKFAARRPALAVGIGGFASGPAILAALALGVPTLLVEPNAIPGRTNRMLAPFASAIAVGFDVGAKSLRGSAVVTGNPVRDEIEAIPPRPDGPLASVLSFGGSRGARALADAWIGALPRLGRLGLRLELQAGAADVERVRDAVRESGVDAEVAPFFDDIAARLARADLIVSRSGASTVSELAACGRASILVPYPYAADDHQRANAEVLGRPGGAIVIDASRFGPEPLVETLELLRASPARLTEMSRVARTLARPGAAKKIAELALRLGRLTP